MTVKRIIANLLVLIVAAVAVFYIGWVQFRIKPGNCGVMVSKTGGVYEKPILPGRFEWRWERLLPTNVTLHSFSLEPYKSTQRFSGSLPSADVYAGLLDGGADFSYSISMDVALSVEPDALVSLVKANSVQGQEELVALLEGRAKLIAQDVADSLLAGAFPLRAGVRVLDGEELSRLAEKHNGDFSSIILHSVEIGEAALPDTELYASARSLYDGYQKDLKESLRERAEQHAYDVYENDKTVELLERYAKLVKKYPQLRDVQNLANVAEVLKSFQTEADESAGESEEPEPGDTADGGDDAGQAGEEP